MFILLYVCFGYIWFPRGFPFRIFNLSRKAVNFQSKESSSFFAMCLVLAAFEKFDKYKLHSTHHKVWQSFSTFSVVIFIPTRQDKSRHKSKWNKTNFYFPIYLFFSFSFWRQVGIVKHFFRSVAKQTWNFFSCVW